jgi:outer membrane protein assembly factor BamB
VLVFAISFAMAALALPASAQSPTISLSPRHGPPTQRVQVAGADFAAAEVVTIVFDATEVGSVTTDGSGAFQMSFQVPKGALPGNHVVRASGSVSGLRAHGRLLDRTNWPQFRFGPQHTGYNPYENVLGPSTVGGMHMTFRKRTIDSIISSPAVSGRDVYVGSENGNLYAMNAVNGHIKWSYAMGAEVNSSPAVANRVVYEGAGGTLYALRAATGTLLWSYPTSGGSPTVVNGVVYVGSSNVSAFDAATGTLLWTTPYGKSSPAVGDGIVYVGSGNGSIYAFAAATGALLWTYATGGAVRTTPAVANGVVYVGSSDDHFYALDGSTGSVLWSQAIQVNGSDSSPAVANGVVYVGSEDGNLYALDAFTGSTVWVTRTRHGQVETSPAVANGVVYVGFDHKVAAYDASTGVVLWMFTTREWVYSSPAVVNGAVYVGCLRELYYFGL